MLRVTGRLAVPPFKYTPIVGKWAQPKYTKVSSTGVRTVAGPGGKNILMVDPNELAELTARGFRDISHLLRTSHLESLAAILKDPEASDNDRFVAKTLLKNACIAAGRILPSCQDTGSAIIMGKKGERVWLDGPGSDHEALSAGVYKTYTSTNLRYSQMAPLDMYNEKNTGTNLPAQIDIYSQRDYPEQYDLLYIAKGGGSANKSYLYQETKATLNPSALEAFLAEKIKTIGTSACPPYHLAIVIGGTSAEDCLKTVKLASTKVLDDLPTKGTGAGEAIRCPEMEQIVAEICRNKIGYGAQFGGKYFAHDVRVIRMPRHGASLPIGIGVSCSADRQALARVNSEGFFLEQLEEDPARFLPDDLPEEGNTSVKIDMRTIEGGMTGLRQELSKLPVSTRISLTGTLVVARDIAHARIREMLAAGHPMPQYMRDHPVYYAGPAKTPDGYASGSFGPTTAGRMDSFVDLFMENGGSYVMLAKGNRSTAVTRACKKHRGFYLGSIGGPAAILAAENIKNVEVIDFPELGMEAVHKIEVVDFPAFVVVDDKGHDFFAN